MTHQELLEAYYKEAHQCIWERSTQIQKDLDELEEKCRQYAKDNNLETPFLAKEQ